MGVVKLVIMHLLVITDESIHFLDTMTATNGLPRNLSVEIVIFTSKNLKGSGRIMKFHRIQQNY